jgi:hypothetical protein
MKPVTVISASGPRRVASAQEPVAVGGQAPAADEGRRSRIVWAAVGVTVLAALAGYVVSRGDDRPTDPGVSVPSSSVTPSEVVPGRLTAPFVDGRRREDGRVVFTWRSQAPMEPGDEWVWERFDTNEVGRTADREVVFRTADQVCIAVRLERGSLRSSSARHCVP